jgi:Fe2+ or Zn2+ uptake regulation protein
MEILKEKNIVLTPQRMAVWEYIKENKNHPCVEAVYEQIRKQFSSVSLATVYSILQTFCNAGLLRELNIRKGKACFDPYMESHHHLLCKECSRIYDVKIKCKNSDFCEVDGHAVEAVHGYFYGVCKNCKKSR